MLSQGPQSPTDIGPNRQRVRALEDFLARQNIGDHGFLEAPATLMCLLTPRERRQWRTMTPATYTRPYPFGSSVVAGEIPRY